MKSFNIFLLLELFTASTFAQTVSLPPYYGVQKKPDFICGVSTVTDYLGNVYNTVKIGDQCWLKENLRSTKYNDGTNIPNVTDGTTWEGLTTPAYCWYDNSYVAYGSVYGALYNWHTVNTGKLCPIGWHVPSDNEWNVMELYLIANGYNYDSTFIENEIAKALSATTMWAVAINPGCPGNTDYPEYRNKTGFTALPGGNRFKNGIFGNAANYGIWWTSTPQDSDSSWAKLIYTNSVDVGVSVFNNNFGFSVRCIKD